MVLVFNPYGTALPASAATAGCERVEVAEYRTFVRRATGARCAVVVLPHVADADIDRLSRFSLAYPELPLILATLPSAEATLALSQVRFRSVLWLPELSGLDTVLRRLEQRAGLERLARAVAHAAQLPPRVQRSIVAALRYQRPFRTVAAMAVVAGCTAEELDREWRRVEAWRASDLTPKRFVARVALLRALELKDGSGSWVAVGEALGVPYRRLAHMAQRATGRSLSELWRRGLEEEARDFEERLLARLRLEQSPAPR